MSTLRTPSPWDSHPWPKVFGIDPEPVGGHASTHDGELSIRTSRLKNNDESESESALSAEWWVAPWQWKYVKYFRKSFISGTGKGSRDGTGLDMKDSLHLFTMWMGQEGPVWKCCLQNCKTHCNLQLGLAWMKWMIEINEMMEMEMEMMEINGIMNE